MKTWISTLGYRMCHDKDLKRDINFSWSVWNSHHPNDMIVKGSRHHIHHIDGNKLNDDPSNLKKESGGEHVSKHCQGKNNPMFGKKQPEYVKEIISKANKGNKYTLGYRHTEEAKERMSRLSLERGTTKGKNNPMFGRKHSAETRKKISEARRKGMEIMKDGVLRN